ncbi:ABC transporter permease [Jiangella sp. DSM 45060]|uniref:ABC transporter permease n=1 Tax=Jiangella sp. DSM 45060 TaxID=1798224 RepID=UPI00087BDF79|nr:ABC transporter permease [Jiangella sp. DSM 45060]SDT16462.1 peptide/nickel transport system permease protein [Jiangella sp. DSM 45060]
MVRYAAVRLAWAVPTVLGIVLLGFILTRVAPGDPVQAMIGEFPAPPEYADEIRERFGLDQSLPTQFWLFLRSLAGGDLGFSFAHNAPVLDIILDRMANTLLLMVPALVLAALLGILLGILGARRAGTRLDTLVTVVTISGQSVPVFWLAMLLVLVFSVQLGMFPVAGMLSITGSDTALGVVGDYLWHWVLPGITLTLAYMTVVARVARSSILETMHQDYVLTAEAKGLTRREVMRRHIFRNALPPIVTVIGFNFGLVLTGAVLTETVFGWPGIGSLFVQAVTNRDYPVIQGVFLFSAIVVVLVNLLVDLLYPVIDPRMRGSHARV